MKYSKALVAVLLLGVVGLVGCEQASEVRNEVYAGVPKNGDSCKEAYQLPANQVKCTNADSRH